MMLALASEMALTLGVPNEGRQPFQLLKPEEKFHNGRPITWAPKAVRYPPRNLVGKNTRPFSPVRLSGSSRSAFERRPKNSNTQFNRRKVCVNLMTLFPPIPKENKGNQKTKESQRNQKAKETKSQKSPETKRAPKETKFDIFDTEEHAQN